MRSARMAATIGATVLVAFSAGHIVENGDTTLTSIGAGLAGQGAAIASARSDIPTFPRPPIETLQATPFPSTRSWASAAKASIDFGVLNSDRLGEDTSKGCLNELTAKSMDDAMLRISVRAPCNVNEPVTIRHASLAFTVRTTKNGRVTVDMPALTETAHVQAVFQDGYAVDTTVDVPDAADFHRVGLTWRGQTGLHIHALEFGAERGESGHIWAGAPGYVGETRIGEGGYLTTLGDASLLNANMAEVYTYPVADRAAPGTVRLTVDAEVRNTNCGGIIAAHTVQPDGLGGTVPTDLTLRLPECHAVGEHIQLKNVLRDLKIASN
ncbi:MAG: hypothetical protein AAGF74_11545 [Pseudomonadota bacterium]